MPIKVKPGLSGLPNLSQPHKRLLRKHQQRQAIFGLKLSIRPMVKLVVLYSPNFQWLDSICPTFQPLIIIVSKCPNLGQCCVQVFDGWTVYFQLSNCWTVLCTILQCPMAYNLLHQYSVRTKIIIRQTENLTGLFLTVLWFDSAFLTVQLLDRAVVNVQLSTSQLSVVTSVNYQKET